MEKKYSEMQITNHPGLKIRVVVTDYLHRTTTGERGSSLDTEGVWLRLGESRVSWVTSFFFSPSPVLGGDETSNDAFFSSPDGLLYG